MMRIALIWKPSAYACEGDLKEAFIYIYNIYIYISFMGLQFLQMLLQSFAFPVAVFVW